MHARTRKNNRSNRPLYRVGVYGYHDHDNGLSFGHHRRTEYIILEYGV